MTPTALLLAGEASGDEYGAALAGELRARRPDLRLLGTGGPRMQAAGVELLAGLERLAVMGFVEVLPRLPFFRALLGSIESLLEQDDVVLVVPIDYPGFNLRVARAAHARRRPVLYYVAPKVWAWRPSRARALAAHADRVATILPFETTFLQAAGVRAEYVGHPLLDRPDDGEDEATFRARWGIDPGRPLLALLPGSRSQEVARHLGLFVGAAELVRSARPDVVPVLSRSPTLARSLFEGQPHPVVDGARALLRHADAALAKSGTTTLEAAIEGTPTVVAYRTSTPTWVLARALLRTEHVALPNLVAGRGVVPEHLQGAATPGALADALLPLLDPHSAERRAQLDGLAAVRAELGGPGAAGRVADLALDLMGDGA